MAELRSISEIHVFTVLEEETQPESIAYVILLTMLVTYPLTREDIHNNLNENKCAIQLDQKHGSTTQWQFMQCWS